MNWLSNYIRPKIRSIVGSKDVPENLWQKCPSCEGMLFHRDLAENLNVCNHCGHHMKITIKERLALIFDDSKYERLAVPSVPQDPLKFKDKKKYVDRLKDAQSKTREKDAIVVAFGMVGGNPTVVAAFNFAFMGGSMGAAVGEGIVRAAEVAVQRSAALIAIPASGGARMQEGMVSLIQLPRSVIAVQMVKDAGLPYLVLLTDPTTGGVSASFAMLGDIHLAEPGCMIGFAGKRVIEETIREQLPAGFQTAEYCREHGMVDVVVPRQELKETLSRILSLLMQRIVDDGSSGGSKGSGRKGGRSAKDALAAKVISAGVALAHPTLNRVDVDSLSPANESGGTVPPAKTNVRRSNRAARA
ncbi:MAG: acetyl-CoA carboxylase carboxyltransferase subunit beta [Alphaproteobacteria bacterium]|jgi:acetyl-CoA carboxylase carboxyl transferase subunit beta|nr:acetyl-CoA carboxylase carboxyltransferase subunit beta [Alphaproteobacteria bacterium]MCB1550882.1 acetyl-CoA carboxylase carboxyltransferase subunit beta [Alphaproteobacteria bacterium]MCB9985609.1 acetyl-CoA carboxylase carboxyltransferase subunit beta [Micavibrio sp.]HPQ51069.1 acetyl-CoA carboxylase, carboxyltransferase subunit beta [Alphaproteobacteria bacterium]HRK98762.1 acetyl-CoA carboxylase, carboxyltransferase subunit beta [Alphaproteobacteria bacterium]